MVKMPASFRPDIEGLRALAVLAVVAFHHDWRIAGNPFSGGFVGVDIFFVISGYLITGNILRDSRGGNFSFRQFYWRRIRRLFPALLAVSLAVLLTGALVASPREMVDLAGSAVTAVFWVSNVYFWRTSGYFDAAADQKPLLHFWSLSVEEQFYLVWPAMVVGALVLARRRAWGRGHGAAALVLLAISSTLAAEWILGASPSAAFYLTPFRMGEFALGGLAACIPIGAWPRWVSETATFLALGSMIAPVFLFSERTGFPGINALWPCLGTGWMVWMGQRSRLSGILRLRGLVWLGSLSYSLYLTHWPVSVFYRQWRGSGESSSGEIVLLGAISLILAVALHYGIEQPLRLRGGSEPSIGSRPFLIGCASATALVAGLAGSAALDGGWVWRFPPERYALVANAELERKRRFEPFWARCLAPGQASCRELQPGRENILILGDSHAPDIFNALLAADDSPHYVLRDEPGCPPMAREDYGILPPAHPSPKACIDHNEAVLHGGLLAEVDGIVINSFFQWYRPEHLRHTITWIRTRTDAPIRVFGNYLVFQEDLPDAVLRLGIAEKVGATYVGELAPSSFAYEEELIELAEEMDFRYISKRELLCGGTDVADCPVIVDGKLVTYDKHHLSLAAARRLGLTLAAQERIRSVAGK